MEIKLSHPEVREPLVFRSMKEVIDWAQREYEFWSPQRIASQTNAVQNYLSHAQRSLERLLTAARSEESTETAVETHLKSLASTLQFLSTGPRGQLLTSLRELGREPKALGIALGAFLNREEIRNLVYNRWEYVFDTIDALSAIAVFEGGGDPQRLVTLLHAINKQQEEWSGELATVKNETANLQQTNEVALKRLNEAISAAETRANGLANKFEGEIANVRKKFEEEFALRTPMTYWNEKAKRHRKESRRYRWWFTGILVVGVAVLSAIGYLILFPFMKHFPTAYWALILFSVAIAVWAWPLRMTSKQYLVHQQLFEDATERSVIAETFLALNEQAKLSEKEREMLLGALVRHAGISIVGDDAGLNLTDVVTMKTLMKP